MLLVSSTALSAPTDPCICARIFPCSAVPVQLQLQLQVGVQATATPGGGIAVVPTATHSALLPPTVTYANSSANANIGANGHAHGASSNANATYSLPVLNLAKVTREDVGTGKPTVALSHGASLSARADGDRGHGLPQPRGSRTSRGSAGSGGLVGSRGGSREVRRARMHDSPDSAASRVTPALADGISLSRHRVARSHAAHVTRSLSEVCFRRGQTRRAAPAGGASWRSSAPPPTPLRAPPSCNGRKARRLRPTRFPQHCVEAAVAAAGAARSAVGRGAARAATRRGQRP